jgi:hypothetical protein
MHETVRFHPGDVKATVPPFTRVNADTATAASGSETS